MEANAQNPEVQEPSPEGGLGARLVAAREAQGLTLAVVASRLRLSAATLQALESNRYEDLPEPIFVRGYLRAYARLLGMEQKALVAEYDRLVGAVNPVLKPSPMIRRQSTARAPSLRGVIALLGLASLVMFGSWWYSRLNHHLPGQNQTVSSEAEQPVSLASALPTPPSDSLKPELAPAFGSDTPTQSPENAATEKNTAPVKSEPPAGEAALPPVRESPVSTNAEAVVQRQDVEATVKPAAPDLPIAPLASEHGRLVKASRAPMGEDVLVIKANDESWADIVDANGYQLLYYPLRPGMVLRLQGQAPFRVFLGNAPAVDLSLNQKRFDHTSFHRRNNTARFTLGDES